MKKINLFLRLYLIIGMIGLISCRPGKGPVFVNRLDTNLIVKAVYENGHITSGLLPSGISFRAGYIIEARLTSLTLSRPDGEILFEAGTYQPSLLDEMNNQRPLFVLFVEDTGVRRVSRKELSEYNDREYNKKKNMKHFKNQ